MSLRSLSGSSGSLVLLGYLSLELGSQGSLGLLGTDVYSIGKMLDSSVVQNTGQLTDGLCWGLRVMSLRLGSLGPPGSLGSLSGCFGVWDLWGVSLLQARASGASLSRWDLWVQMFIPLGKHWTALCRAGSGSPGTVSQAGISGTPGLSLWAGLGCLGPLGLTYVPAWVLWVFLLPGMSSQGPVGFLSGKCSGLSLGRAGISEPLGCLDISLWARLGFLSEPGWSVLSRTFGVTVWAGLESLGKLESLGSLGTRAMPQRPQVAAESDPKGLSLAGVFRDNVQFPAL